MFTCRYRLSFDKLHSLLRFTGYQVSREVSVSCESKECQLIQVIRWLGLDTSDFLRVGGSLRGIQVDHLGQFKASSCVEDLPPVPPSSRRTMMLQ